MLMLPLCFLNYSGPTGRAPYPRPARKSLPPTGELPAESGPKGQLRGAAARFSQAQPPRCGRINY